MASARNIDFSFTPPEVTMKITREELRKTLERVRDELLRHGINGGPRKLEMEIVCDKNRSCGTVACIGGWVSLFILGFEGKSDREREIVLYLFDSLMALDPGKLSGLFHNYEATRNFNHPNVAATAIQRYLDGKDPWPFGEMPNVLPYKRTRERNVKARPKKRSR